LKISLITVTYNSAATIKATIESVAMQDYSHIEYIIIDGNSTDGTQQIITSYGSLVHKFISEPDNGMYDAINKGIKLAGGEVIGLLNSDDFFASEKSVSIIAQAFLENSIDAIYANIAFVKPGNLSQVVRSYSSKKFKVSKFKYGYMPAHPSFYVKKDCFEKYGLYKLDYKIAADYELVMRFMLKHKIKTLYIDQLLVYMQTGGLSNKTPLSRYILNKEIVRACKENGVETNMALISLKYFTKVFQYIAPLIRK
jgi:glycosyltransferase involved in cell wall biosynthesis